MSATPWPNVKRYGPTGALLTYDSYEAARREGERLGGCPLITESVVAFDDVLVTWAPRTHYRSILSLIQELRTEAQPPSERRSSPRKRRFTLEVTYDGPDLRYVAETKCMSVAQVVDAHASHVYSALAVGFQPGFAYLGEVPPELRLPRRTNPRPAVPPGSVAIANEHTAVYPHESPGGWHLLGLVRELPAALLLDDDIGALIRVGDEVEFVPTLRS